MNQPKTEIRPNGSVIGTCGLCGRSHRILLPISKQIGGAFHLLDVCVRCYNEHQQQLERTRQNFQAQFGDK